MRSATGRANAAERPADWPAAVLAVDWPRGPRATAARRRRGAAPAARAAVAVQAKVQSTREDREGRMKINVVKRRSGSTSKASKLTYVRNTVNTYKRT